MNTDIERLLPFEASASSWIHLVGVCIEIFGVFIIVAGIVWSTYLCVHFDRRLELKAHAGDVVGTHGTAHVAEIRHADEGEIRVVAAVTGGAVQIAPLVAARHVGAQREFSRHEGRIIRGKRLVCSAGGAVLQQVDFSIPFDAVGGDELVADAAKGGIHSLTSLRDRTSGPVRFLPVFRSRATFASSAQSIEVFLEVQ